MARPHASPQTGNESWCCCDAQHKLRTSCCLQKEGVDIAWLQTTEEVHLLVPAEQEVHKADLSFQVHPQRLHLEVKGETLLSGDLPESVDIDGMHGILHMHATSRQACNSHCLSRLLLGL